MWMHLLKFVKVLFLKVLQLHCELGDVYNARDPCEPQFVTGHIALDEKLVTQHFPEAVSAPQLCRTLKTIAKLIIGSSNNARFE